MILLLNLLVAFTVAPDVIEINDPLTATLTLEIDQSAPLDIPQLRGRLLESGHFMLLSETVDRSEHAARLTWVIEPLEAGHFPVSLYQIELLPGQPIFTPIHFVTVKPFEVPQSLPPLPLLPLKPEIPPSLSAANLALMDRWTELQPRLNAETVLAKTLPWIPLLFTLFLALAAPFALILFQRKRPVPIPPSPEEVARKQLERIEQQLAAKSYPSPDAFIVDLTQTVREYIQEKYGLLAPYRTTEEFLVVAAAHPEVQGAASDKLGVFLKAADLVKFAGRTPSESEYTTALTFAKTYIQAN